MKPEEFLTLLRVALKKNIAHPVSLAGLEGEQLEIARRINEEIARAAKYEIMAEGSLEMIEKTEHFYEKIVRVISAMINLSGLSKADTEMGELCKEITIILSKELAFDNCSIMLKEDEESRNLLLVAGCGKGDKYIHGHKWKRLTRIKRGEGIAGMAFSAGKAIFVPDTANDNRFKKFETGVNIASILAVPIRDGEKILGVINFSHPVLNELYDFNMENLIQLLADFVGQVITLSRLYNDMSRWNVTLTEEVERKTAELTKKNLKLRKLALIDPLTGIYNRRFFFKRIEEEFTRSVRHSVEFSLLFIDIDNLKPINDSQGHSMGDKVIKALAKCLKDIGRKGDVACRLGGDEFGLMLMESDVAGAKRYAERLRSRFSKLGFRGIKHAPTISIGISNTAVYKFKDHMHLYNAADEALYEAKQIKDAICLYGEKRKKRAKK